MGLLVDCMLVGGVAVELVGAGVLAHCHNVESVVELRAEAVDEGTALGQPDAISTHAMLLAEKRVGFSLLTVGLLLSLVGLVGDSSEVWAMGAVGVGAIAVGVLASVLVTRVLGQRYRALARQAASTDDSGDALPQQ